MGIELSLMRGGTDRVRLQWPLDRWCRPYDVELRHIQGSHHFFLPSLGAFFFIFPR